MVGDARLRSGAVEWVGVILVGTIFVEDSYSCLSEPVCKELASVVLRVVGVPEMVVGINVTKYEEVVVESVLEVVNRWGVSWST